MLIRMGSPSRKDEMKTQRNTLSAFIFTISAFMSLMAFSCAKDEIADPTKPSNASKEPDQIQQTNFQKAPAFVLQDALNPNKQVSLKDFEDKVTFINFWATWCQPCKTEMPDIVSLYNKHKNRGFEVIAISGDDVDTQKEIKPYSEEFKMNFSILLATADVVKSYKLTGLPSTYILDRKHYIRFAHVGAQPKEVFEAEVAKLLSE